MMELLKWSLSPIFTPTVDLVRYGFENLNTGKFTPKESFNNAYAEEVYELEQVRTSNKLLRTIIYSKYEKVYLNMIMINQCQHLTETKRN